MTYKIVGRTNGYIAKRDFRFNGKTTIVIRKGLTLRKAQGALLIFFNWDYANEIGKPYKNWGLVRCNFPYQTSSHSDGTRSYEYDSRYFSIEPEKVEETNDIDDKFVDWCRVNYDV